MNSFFFGNSSRGYYAPLNSEEEANLNAPSHVLGATTATYFGYSPCPEISEKQVISSMNSCLAFDSPFQKPEVTLLWSKETGFSATDKKTQSALISVKVNHVAIGHLQSKKGGSKLKYFGLVCWDAQQKLQICHTFKIHGDAVKFFKCLQNTFNQLAAPQPKSTQQQQPPKQIEAQKTPASPAPARGAIGMNNSNNNTNTIKNTPTSKPASSNNNNNNDENQASKVASPLKRPSFTQDHPSRPAKRPSLSAIDVNLIQFDSPAPAKKEPIAPLSNNRPADMPSIIGAW